MAEDGFLVKFEGAKERPKRCYAAAFDYDKWSYIINDKPSQALPSGVKRIIIEVE